MQGCDDSCHGPRAGLAVSIGGAGAAPIAPDTPDNHDEAPAPNREVVLLGYDKARGRDFGVEIVTMEVAPGQWEVTEVRHSTESPAFGTPWPTSNTGTVTKRQQNQEKAKPTTPPAHA